MKANTRTTALAAISLVVAAAALALLYWRQRPAAEPEAPTPAVTNAAESDAIEASHGLARRDGASLFLRQKSGEIVTLTDHLQCGDMVCPKELSVSYRYLGWHEKIGGYALQVNASPSQTMVLTYGEDEPVLIDARHAAEAKEVTPLPAVVPAAIDTEDSLREWLSDLTAERDQNEKPQLAMHGDQVSRDGSRLTLIYGDHRHLTLQDDLVCGQLACPPQISRSFDYVGESPDGQFHVVHEEGNETEEGLLIDHQGKVLVTLSVPSFAPDGTVAVTAISDLEAMAPRRLEVWGLAGGKASLVFSVPAREEDDTVYELVGWVDSSHLRLKRGPWGGDRRSAVMLVRDAAGWHIEEGDVGN